MGDHFKEVQTLSDPTQSSITDLFEACEQGDNFGAKGAKSLLDRGLDVHVRSTESKMDLQLLM